MNSLGLAIAGICTRVSSKSRALLERLRTRYAGFLVEPVADSFEVQIDPDPNGIPYEYPSPDFAFTDSCIAFELPGFIGFIDPEKSARLKITSLHAPAGADYFLRTVYALLAYRAGGLMVHGAGIVRDGRAFLFFGPSGSGKTTVARLSTGCIALNDDLIVLTPEARAWRAHGTPFTNPTQVSPTSRSAPLAALLRLVQSPDVYLSPLVGAPAVAELLASVPVLNGGPAPPLERCRQILQSVPSYLLHFRPEPSFWQEIDRIEAAQL